MPTITCGVTRIRNPGAGRKGTCGPLARLAGAQGDRRFLLTCAHVVAPAGFPLTTTACEVLEPDGVTWTGVGSVLAFSDDNDGVDVAVVELTNPAARMTTAVGELGLPQGVTSLAGPGLAIHAMCGVTGVRRGLSLGSHREDVELDYIDSHGDRRKFKYAQHLTTARFTAPGDSGSTILDFTNFFLGMVVGARLDAHNDTIIAPFTDVLEFFRTRKNLDLELVV